MGGISEVPAVGFGSALGRNWGVVNTVRASLASVEWEVGRGFFCRGLNVMGDTFYLIVIMER